MAPAATAALFSPFPSDSLTVHDAGQQTGLRVNLPMPDCAAEPTACQETALLNQFDGFSLRARAEVRFSGPIDPATIPGGIFYVELGNRMAAPVPLNQIEYDPLTYTVYGKPNPVLAEHRQYALIVTDGIRDTAGAAVAPDPAFAACLNASDSYCAALAAAVDSIPAAPQRVVAASLFTTMSVTNWLVEARTVVESTPPAPALATPQSAFRIANLSGLVLHEQTGANPTRFSDISIPLDTPLLTGLDRVVIGMYQSPNFLRSDLTLPPGPPPAATMNTVYFNALLPAMPKPAAGYPVVIFGHGFGDSRFGGPTAVAPTLAGKGIAVIAINAVGHGFGPLGTVTFTDKSGSVTLPAGGRGVDVNGDGRIDSEEGCALVSPIAFGTRDCFRQTVVDLMQLAHLVRSGLDLDGDGTPDLDGSHIYYAGQSLGAMYGTIFTAAEPTVRAATLNVGGGSAADIARWSPSYTYLADDMLRLRVPSLVNQRGSYNEDYVLPDRPPHVVTFPGAMRIQDVFERLEWLSMPGEPLAFASHLSRPVLVQMARADRTMPNPATTQLIRAGGLQGSTWIYRHDLARAKDPSLPLNPHAFLALFLSLEGGAIKLPGLDALSVALDAQQQLAGFFAADGASIANPNGLSQALFGFPVFEQPATLPTDFGYAGHDGPGHIPVLRGTQ